MPFPSGHETRLDTEFDRSKSCFIISFAWWTKLVNRNMILHNVSHKRSHSQSMRAASCIPSIFMTIDKSSSSRIKKLPSSYSFELAEGKVFPEKKKRLRNVHFLHVVNFTEFRPFYMATILFQVGEFVKIVSRVLIFFTSRDRAPFCPGFVSVIYLLWMFHDKKLTPL